MTAIAKGSLQRFLPTLKNPISKFQTHWHLNLPRIASALAAIDVNKQMFQILTVSQECHISQTSKVESSVGHVPVDMNKKERTAPAIILGMGLAPAKHHIEMRSIT